MVEVRSENIKNDVYKEHPDYTLSHTSDKFYAKNRMNTGHSIHYVEKRTYERDLSGGEKFGNILKIVGLSLTIIGNLAFLSSSYRNFVANTFRGKKVVSVVIDDVDTSSLSLNVPINRIVKAWEAGTDYAKVAKLIKPLVEQIKNNEIFDNRNELRNLCDTLAKDIIEEKKLRGTDSHRQRSLYSDPNARVLIIRNDSQLLSREEAENFSIIFDGTRSVQGPLDPRDIITNYFEKAKEYLEKKKTLTVEDAELLSVFSALKSSFESREY